MTLDRDDWRQAAQCRDLDPTHADALFYPSGSPRQVHETTRHTLATYCGPCPTKAACLAAALLVETSGGHYGIRGGLSEHQRRKLPAATRAALIEAGAA